MKLSNKSKASTMLTAINYNNQFFNDYKQYSLKEVTEKSKNLIKSLKVNIENKSNNEDIFKKIKKSFDRIMTLRTAINKKRNFNLDKRRHLTELLNKSNILIDKEVIKNETVFYKMLENFKKLLTVKRKPPVASNSKNLSADNRNILSINNYFSKNSQCSYIFNFSMFEI